MNTFNRFLVILICITGVLIAVGALLLVWGSPRDLELSFRQLAVILRDRPFIVQAVSTAFSISFILVALLILAGEFTGQEPAAIPLNAVRGGGATVSVETVVDRIKAEVELVPGVRLARPQVKRVKGGLEAMVEVLPDAEAHLPTKVDEIRQVVRQSVEDQLGVTVKQIRVNFQPDRERGRARPAGDIFLPGATTESPPPRS